jgi:hypothetical protein
VRSPSAARSRAGACGSSCRPRRSRAPAWATTSGIRKPPPISISCPRETTTSRPRPASAAGQQHARRRSC